MKQPSMFASPSGTFWTTFSDFLREKLSIGLATSDGTTYNYTNGGRGYEEAWCELFACRMLHYGMQPSKGIRPSPKKLPVQDTKKYVIVQEKKNHRSVKTEKKKIEKPGIKRTEWVKREQ